MQILFPSDPLNNQKVDDAFADEFLAAASAGYICLLFDFDALGFNEFRPNPTITNGADILYRGWMLNPKGYSRLNRMIGAQGGRLVTSPEAYVRCHHIVSWYEQCREFTAETFLCSSREELTELVSNLNWSRYFIKDFVKSNTAGIGSVANDAQQAVDIVDMIEMYRGEIEGGIAVRRFEDYKPETETRYFVVAGKPFSHDDMVPDIVDKIVSKIDAPFYSIDLVENQVGNLRLVELGDGQVSSRKKWPIGKFLELFGKIAISLSRRK